MSSPGKAGSGSYAGFGIDFMSRTGTARKKQSYDASKYTGVGFWAKCAKDLRFAFFKAPDATQDADIDPAPCSYSAGTDSVSVGQVVQVTGTVSEFGFFSSGGTLTELTPTSIEVCGTPGSIVATNVALPAASRETCSRSAPQWPRVPAGTSRRPP